VGGPRQLENRISAGLSKAECRRFGLTVGGAFVVIALVSRWRGHTLAPIVPASVGVVLLAGAIVAPMALAPVHRWWMGLARVISRITTPIVLGILYFIVITPFGLLMRAIGRDPLRRKRDVATHLITRSTAVSSSMVRQF